MLDDQTLSQRLGEDVCWHLVCRFVLDDYDPPLNQISNKMMFDSNVLCPVAISIYMRCATMVMLWEAFYGDFHPYYYVLSALLCFPDILGPSCFFSLSTILIGWYWASYHSYDWLPLRW